MNLNYSSIKYDGLVKSQRHQLLKKFGCSERRVLKGTRVSNGLMTPKSDCILHPVDFLRVHLSCHSTLYCARIQLVSATGGLILENS